MGLDHESRINPFPSFLLLFFLLQKYFINFHKKTLWVHIRGLKNEKEKPTTKLPARMLAALL